MRTPPPPVPPVSSLREPEPATLRGCFTCLGAGLLGVLLVALMVLGVLWLVEHV